MCPTVTSQGKEYILDETKTQISRYTYLLEYKNFSQKVTKVQANKEYGSPSTIAFCNAEGCVKIWNCEFYPVGLRNSDNTDLYFLIWRKDCIQNMDNLVFNLSVLDNGMKKVGKGSIMKMKKKKDTDDSMITCEYSISPTQLSTILDSTKNILSNDNTLQVLIDCDVIMKKIVEKKQVINFDIPKSIIQDNLSKFFQDDKFSDVVLEVKDVELSAHRMILVAQSPVFLKIFDRKGSRTNRVKIDDIEPHVAQKMLQFIYTDDKPSEIEDCADKLIIAAQKYQLERLVVICEEILCKQISLDNVLDTFISADVHKFNTLRKSAVEFIQMHPTLLEEEEFEYFERNHAELAFEIYHHLTSIKRRRIV